LPRREEDGGSWLRRPKLYKRVVEPHKKKKKKISWVVTPCAVLLVNKGKVKFTLKQTMKA
jgi:hypothetical protein